MRIYSRRMLFKGVVAAPLGVAVASALLPGCSGSKENAATSAASCVDPSTLTASEASLRQANAYVEKAPDPGKTCSVCAFFTPATDGSPCGTCQIFVGGPANAGGHCSSWAAKAPAAAPAPA